jgi:Cu-Zn family superoxide dismutase
VVADSDGRSRTVLVAQVWLHELVGRTVVVHSDPDDEGLGGTPESLKTGRSGRRVASGVVCWR